MYPYYQNSYVRYVFLFLVSALFFACLGCDSLLPTDFKAKNFTASSIDIKAGNLLTSDTLNDAQGFTVSYQYVPLDGSGQPISLGNSTPPTPVSFRSLPITWSIIHSQSLGDTIDNKIILSGFDSLVAVLPELHQDSLIVINYSDSSKVSYVVLKSAQAKDIYFYTSLLYYYRASNATSNINDYVTVELVKRDTSVVSPMSTLSTESTYNSSERILSASNSIKIVPVMSARYSIHLDQGSVYLVRFTLTNPSQISNPTPASPSSSIANQFKVVILSY